MTMAMLRTVEPGSPSEADVAAARVASRALARLSGHGCVRVEARSDQDEAQSFILPITAVRLLTDMMTHLAEGRRVSVMPEDAELTTKQAADMLNVSRPYLVGLLQAGKLAHHMAGTHRRILVRDLLDYRRRQMESSGAAMDELAAQAQELDMGY